MFRKLTVAVVVALTSLTAGVVGSPAQAAPAPDFYTPPADLPSIAGSVIRTEPLPLFVSVPGFDGGYPGSAQRVMYSSRLETGEPTAVTGTFIDAATPWRGGGARPTIVIGPGTMGQGDQCAPSRAFSTGLNAQIDPVSLSANQEALSAGAWTALGARVFVTDYIGLGTPGIHTYVNRVEEAHAMIDAARAANNLSGTGSSTPIAFWGYSQGGGASAAAAELQPTDAPELNVKGTWAGGPVADQMKVLAQVDGSLIGGVIGFAFNGLVARNPQLQAQIDQHVSPAGQVVLDQLSTECIGDVILKQPFLRTSSLTRDGRSLLDNLATIPEAGPIFAQQQIGTMKPRAPVFISSGRNDDTVPYGQARQLALDWCDRGATVSFRTDEIPSFLPGTVIVNHFGPELVDGLGSNGALQFLLDRFNGVPISECQIQ